MSLQLDARQRAMLQEMGVRVFWPEATPVDNAVAYPGPAPEMLVMPTPGSHARVALPTAVPAAPPVPRVPATVPVPATTRSGDADSCDLSTLDWEALRRHVEERAAATGARAVFGAGDPHASWLVVGDPPAADEEQAGEPFAGDAGRLLDNMLAAVGVSRRRGAYLTCVMPLRLPGDRNPRPEELAEWAPVLERQVALLQPRVVVAVGRFAVQALTGSAEPIGKLRAQVLRYAGVPLVATFHPSYLLRKPADKARAWADLCLALAQLRPH